jgi:hypothetical protein
LRREILQSNYDLLAAGERPVAFLLKQKMTPARLAAI